MDLLVTLIIGGVVGWLAILANVVVGIVGSFLGAAIANTTGIAPRGELGGWIVSVLGAAVLIALLRAVGVFSRFSTAR
jgi:uncharacterized membrane protein YeaQ/YmgE (transglycosylase-associated protein family)